jgi:hypothetical protein
MSEQEDKNRILDSLKDYSEKHRADYYCILLRPPSEAKGPVEFYGDKHISTASRGKVGRIIEEIIDILEQRLQYKEELLDEYRQRLNLIPPENTGTIYSRMTHAELQKEAFSLVEGIRQLYSKHKEIEDKLRAESSRKEREAESAEERQRIRNEYQDKEHQWFLKSMAKYNSEYKIRAILLHDEMLSRLPKNIRSERIRFMYEHPTNLLGFRSIAEDLEILAMNLEIRVKK